MHLPVSHAIQFAIAILFSFSCFALQGGLQALIGVLKLASERQFTTVKTLAVGAILRITAEPDVQVLYPYVTPVHESH